MFKLTLLSKIKKKVNVTGITSDSRNIKKGYIFFVISGYSVDGKQYIDEAIKKNVSAIVTTDRKIKIKNIEIFYVKDVRKALSEASFEFYRSKIDNLIAVTGTNGKTSVSYYIYNMLKKLNKRVGIIGTIGNSISIKKKSDLTTPDPITMAKTLQKMSKKNINYVVMEASSHGLEQNRLTGLYFDLGIMTNISHDHLDYHKNFNNYLNSKLKLFKNHIKKSGHGIINKNINQIKKIKKYLIGIKQIHYLDEGKNNIFILNNIKIVNQANTIVSLKYEKKNYELVFKNTPLFQIHNLLLAYYSLVVMGFSFFKIKKFITKMPQIPGRMQFIGYKKSNLARVFVDFAHTPDALKTILVETRKITQGKLHVLFGCGGNRDKTKRRKMGIISIKYADKVIVTDDNPRFENPKKIRNDIIGNVNKIIDYPNRKKAINKSIKNLKKLDVLIIAGKGHEKYQIIKDNYIKFDDVKIAKEACNQL